MEVVKTADIRLVALDMDGTLVNTFKKVAPRDLETLKKAMARGVEVVPASGRTLHTLPEELLALEGLRYFISCNGARISDRLTGRPVYLRTVPQSLLLPIMEEAKKYDCVREAAIDDSLYLARQDDEKELTFLPPYQHDFLRAMRTLTDDFEGKLREAKDGAEKILIFFTKSEDADAFRAWLHENYDLSVSSSLDRNLEINAPGVSKGAALTALAEHLGLSMSAVMACGDSENDMDMLRAAGLGIAMENATAEVLAIADAVTLSNDNCGVSAAIERYVLV